MDYMCEKCGIISSSTKLKELHEKKTVKQKIDFTKTVRTRGGFKV